MEVRTFDFLGFSTQFERNWGNSSKPTAFPLSSRGFAPAVGGITSSDSSHDNGLRSSFQITTLLLFPFGRLRNISQGFGVVIIGLIEFTLGQINWRLKLLTRRSRLLLFTMNGLTTSFQAYWNPVKCCAS